MKQKKNIVRFEDLQVGAFSDDIRDGIKGSVFSDNDKGFATGKTGQEERIKSGVIGATKYSDIKWADTYTDICSPWTSSPIQAVNYVSAHDNLTLWDKLTLSNKDDTEEDRIKMNLLSASIVYTAQGIPFMQAGEEMLRTKPGKKGGFDENSYRSPDKVNSIKWDNLLVEEYADTVAYYQGLIAFRKAHAGLRLNTADAVAENIQALKLGNNLVAGANIAGFMKVAQAMLEQGII